VISSIWSTATKNKKGLNTENWCLSCLSRKAICEV